MPSVEGVDDNVPPTRYGVRGYSNNRLGSGVVGSGVRAGVYGSSSRVGVHGESEEGYGVHGNSSYGYGVLGGSGQGGGVVGGGGRVGVYGASYAGFGMYGSSSLGLGVYGECENSYGVYGHSNGSYGVAGSGKTCGVYGSSYEGYGVYGASDSSYGVYAFSNGADNYALYAGSSFGLAAWLNGEVTVRGPLIKPGGQFKIDHPLDPANKYLSHSFVESPDMKNVYDGLVVLDDQGETEIELPDWFDALNKDFRYQLTAIGAPGPNLHIAEEISDGVINYSNSKSNSNHNSRFKIAGGTSGMKVSWQVTGIRQDPWANVNRIEVEEDKPDKEKGYYIYPDLYEQPPEKGISHLLFPKEEKWQEQLIE
jgi:hypothetical protein